MLVLDLVICECCGKVYKTCLTSYNTPLNSVVCCSECLKKFMKSSLDHDSFIQKYQTIDFAKNKKILDIILADAKNKIKEQFGVEV